MLTNPFGKATRNRSAERERYRAPRVDPGDGRGAKAGGRAGAMAGQQQPLALKEHVNVRERTGIGSGNLVWSQALH